ncbi:hypothetical protein OH491_19290 [Termitidicoccus mucosus]|uniref:hypothetical protein n=1 Tax=Termitidicoccus mucosus TaxID=1184151 RepID=UPI003182E458
MSIILKHLSVCIFILFCAACSRTEQDALQIFNKHFPIAVPSTAVPIAAMESYNPDIEYIICFGISSDDLQRIIKNGRFHKVPPIGVDALHAVLGRLCKRHPEIRGSFKKAIYRYDDNSEPYLFYLLIDDQYPDRAVFVKLGF